MPPVRGNQHGRSSSLSPSEAYQVGPVSTPAASGPGPIGSSNQGGEASYAVRSSGVGSASGKSRHATMSSFAGASNANASGIGSSFGAPPSSSRISSATAGSVGGGGVSTAIGAGSGAPSGGGATLALASAYQELGKELTSARLRSIGNYTLGRPIGEGTFGKVRMGYHRLIPNCRVAIKQIPKTGLVQSLTREIHHHRRLHHPHVMQLYEVLATEQYIWMVSELCAGGELYDYLVEKGELNEQEARRIFGQLCLAVHYVHERGIVHRDLKLENVLLDERCNVKLGDFGFTREFDERRLMDTFCGTTGYAAPEMLAGKKYLGKPVDIWSLGVILYALLCGALPFDDDDEDAMKAKIMQGDFELPPHLSEEASSLVASILVKNPASRPTIREVLGHKWFTKTMIPAPLGSPTTLTGAGGGMSSGSGGGAPMSTVDESIGSGAQGTGGRAGRRSLEEESETTSRSSVIDEPMSPVTTATDNASTTNSSYLSAPDEGRETNTEGATLTASESTRSSRASTSDTAATSGTEAEDEPATVAHASSGKDRSKDLPEPPLPSPLGAPIPRPPKPPPRFAGTRTDSQTTLRRGNSTGSESSARRASVGLSATVPSAIAAGRGRPLSTHIEREASSSSSPELDSAAAAAETTGETTLPSKAPSTAAPPANKSATADAGAPVRPALPERNSSQHSSRGHHRTPSRSKRRSASSYILSDHHAPTLDSTPVDYLALLTLLQPPLFSTPTEQTLLASLSSLGLDVGQVVHSVMNDACDSSGALWWLLKRKADEKHALLQQYNAALAANSTALASDQQHGSPSLAAATGARPASAGSSSTSLIPQTATLPPSVVPAAPPVPPKEPDGSTSTAGSGTGHARQPSFGTVPMYPRSRSQQDALDYAAAKSSVSTSTTATPPAKGQIPKPQVPTRRGTAPPPTAPVTETRTRSTSFTMRQLTSVLTNMSKEKLVDDTIPPTGSASPDAPERAKSPVSALFGKRSTVLAAPRRASKEDSSPGSTSPRNVQPSRTPLEGSSPAIPERKLNSSVDSASSTARSHGDLSNSMSIASLSSVASTADTGAASNKSKFRKSKFMTTVRTWLGTDVKDEVTESDASASFKKKRKTKKGDLPHLAPVQVGSVRKRVTPYPQTSMRGRSGVIPQSPLRGSVSRMSSSNSVYARPSAIRRQSGSTIMSASAAHDGLGIHVRPGSRPSSIHSVSRKPSGLHGRMGSASSSGSGIKASREYAGSLRHRRRASSEGGTIVQRHRVFSSSANSRRNSRAESTDHTATQEHPEDGIEAANRVSIDDSDAAENHSGSHHAGYKTQFLAHKHRSSFKSPAQSSQSHGHRSSTGAGGTQNQPVATWMKSWGKPPTHWAGRVDDEPSKSDMLAALKPKLRDVFAQTEEEEWEDEDEEPTYLGGLGQTSATTSALAGWSNRGPMPDSPRGSRMMSGFSSPPISGADDARPKSIRTMFQPPSLGSDTAPKIISATAPTPLDGLPSSSDSGGSLLAALSANSRIRTAAQPAFKSNTIEEEEEED